MSRIEFEQISENEIEVVIPPETPMEMVQQLTKSFESKGLVEDLAKSTLSVRYFYRPEEDVADQLIKSLQAMAKSDELPYWHPKAQMANQKRVREMEIAERRAKNGIKQPTNVSTAPEPHMVSDAPKPPNPVSPGMMNVKPPKMYDNTPAAGHTAGGTGKRYGYITDPVNKEEHSEDCDCEKCQEMEKSNYGKFKSGSQYSVADNAKRKFNNVGDVAGQGPNSNVKSFSTKPGQMSSKQQASAAAKIQARANKKQPVTQWSPEQIDAENKKRGLKKSWGQHLPFPSAEEEILKLAQETHQSGENAAANQLANLMAGKSMLGDSKLPSAVQQMFAAPPPQPTDEQMFGHLVVSDDMAKSAEQEWGGRINNWLAEASKPISQRFNSEEEEAAYWARIKVADRDDGQSGY